jgi:hypothetical protein
VFGASGSAAVPPVGASGSATALPPVGACGSAATVPSAGAQALHQVSDGLASRAVEVRRSPGVAWTST